MALNSDAAYITCTCGETFQVLAEEQWTEDGSEILPRAWDEAATAALYEEHLAQVEH